MSKQLEQQLKPLYAQRKELRAELTTAHSNLSRKKGRKRRNATDRRIIKKQIMELQSKLGSIEREITSLKDRECQDYQKRRDASASFRLYNAAKAAHIRSVQQWKAEKQKRFRRGEITERVGKDVERAFQFGTVVPMRRLPWRVLPPGELSVTTLHQHYDRLQQVNPRIKYERERITKAFSLRPHQCYIGRDEFEGYMILTFVHTPKALLKRAGLPQIRFHDLRHTCATLLLGRNVNPKIVSEMLGHATIAITLDTYSHVLPNMQSETAKAMEDALS